MLTSVMYKSQILENYTLSKHQPFAEPQLSLFLHQLTMTLPEILKDADGGGASQDQKVKRRKNREYKKCAKKMKMIGEENEKIQEENDLKLQKLRRIEAEIKQQKADLYDSQNKIITEHESRVRALLQEPLVQHLLARSDQLELAQGVMFSPNANSDARVPSEDELKHCFEILSKEIEVLCKVMTA